MTEPVRAMESPKHLYGWFTLKGHKNLVYRMSDVLQLPDKDLAPFDTIAIGLNIGGADAYAEKEPAERLRSSCPTGYLVVSVEQLFSQPWAEMPLLIELQRSTLLYREIRRQMGYYEHVSPCDCKGLRDPNKGKRCRSCDGKGETRTILEMSPEEVRLANGD